MEGKAGTVAEEEVLTEIKVIIAALKHGDKSVLYAPSVDDLFTAYGDAWKDVKSYSEKYGELPSLELMQEKHDLPDVSVPAAPSYYLDTLRSEFIDQRVENLLFRAAEEKKNGATYVEIKSKLQLALGKLDRFSSNTRDLDITDMEEARRRYDEVRARAEAMGGTPGVPTGVDFIDACMPLGLQGGDIMSIIGYPARGKSALGTLIAAKNMVRGYKPLIFTREMSAEAVQDRMFTVMASGLFSNTDLMLGIYNEDDMRRFEAMVSGSGWIVDGNGTGDMTPNFFRGKIDQHRPDYVIVDYLQLCSDNGLTEDMTARMRNLSLQIKDVSNQTSTPFIVISSATPPDNGKIDGPPNVERSAWSRQLAYDSTVSLAIHRHDGNIYEVAAAKNRYGPLFNGFLEWDMDRGTYEEKFELE
jgi:replicative DNA helicase